MKQRKSNYICQMAALHRSANEGFKGAYRVYEVSIKPNTKKPEVSQLHNITCYLTTNFFREEVYYGWCKIKSIREACTTVTYFLFMEDGEDTDEQVKRLIISGTRAGTWGSATICAAPSGEDFCFVSETQEYLDHFNHMVRHFQELLAVSEKMPEVSFSFERLPPILSRNKVA